MILLLDVEIQEFLFEIVALATILDTLFGIVNLEKEKHVVLIDCLFKLSLFNQFVDVLLDIHDLVVQTFLFCRQLRVCITKLF